MGNHAIVLVARYIFARTNYGMSSRYALQYQAGLLGIVVTFALVWKLRARGGAKSAAAVSERGADVSEKNPVSAGLVTRVLAVAFCAMILAGHGYTNYRELQKAPYREAYGENIANAALQYEILSDDEIRETFDYRKSRKESAADVRRALRILKENHWNIFSKVEY
jgi:ABC-type Fe3+ transport system permease subunit